MALRLAYFTLMLLALSGTASAAPPPIIPEDGHSAVILVYSSVGEDDQPDGNISTEMFLSHLTEIETGGYNVMALPKLLESLKKGDPLPFRTIAITFEGASKSALKNAVPALLEKKIPFTVFYAADNADDAAGPYMNWADLKSLAAHDTVTLGLLPASYAKMKNMQDDEIRRQVNKARARHRDMIGGEATLFSYPFGEYSPSYKKIVEDSGFMAAFGQQSGAVSSSSDFFALPRFTMTDEYGDTERFRTAAATLPFPVKDLEPEGTILDAANPVIGFSVPDYLLSSLKSLSCFVTGQPNPDVQILDNRVELRLKETIDEDRIRVNCTLPGPNDTDDDSPTWRWFGLLLAKTPAPDDSTPLQTGLQ